MSAAEPHEEDRTGFQSQLLAGGTSPLRKYQNIAVGSTGLSYLLRYEIASWFLVPMPGALGYLLRGRFYPRLLGSSGRGLLLGRNLSLRHPGRIRLGSNVAIDDNCVLDAKGECDPGITLGDGAVIGRNTILSCKGGPIEIGDNTNISANCMFISESRLSIGNNVLIAGMTYVIAGGNHGTDRTDVPIIRQPMVSKGGIAVGDNCWIGANTTILDGVTIGRDSIVGAGSVVTESISRFSVAVGVPARVIKLRQPTDQA